MEVINTAIPDVLIFKPKVRGDERGFFMETFRQSKLEGLGITERFVQDNHSRSDKNVLRGLHYQVERPQGKLVRAVAGAVFDVVVDMRRSSRWFGRHVSATLSAENKQILWSPPGFAHGFLTLLDATEIIYKCTDYYFPEHERTLLWNDSGVGIQWPLEPGTHPLLSRKDMEGRRFDEAESYP